MPKIGTKNCRWYILSKYFTKNASKTLLKIQWLDRPSCLERRFTVYGLRSFVSDIQNAWTSGAPLPFTSILGMGAFGWGEPPAGWPRAPLSWGTKAFRPMLCPWAGERSPEAGLAWAGWVSLLGWDEHQGKGHT